MNTMFSPVALFVYNRADNTQRTLRALMANTLAPETELYVFSDGGKDEASWAAVREVRTLLHEVEEEVARTHSLLRMTIVERPENFYLERNIIEGISQVLSDHETIIVLEDDIVTSPHFLQFMNDAFRIYKDNQRVMHVGGFTRIQTENAYGAVRVASRRLEVRTVLQRSEQSPLTTSKPSSPSQSDTHRREATLTPNRALAPSPHFYFTPFMSGWGWGTWRDRWNGHFLHFQSREEALEGVPAEVLTEIEYDGVFPCLKDLNRRPIPWDICWGLAIRKAGGLCLYPSRTLVRNIGLDGGTHYGRLPRWITRLIQRYEYDRLPYDGPIEVTAQEPAINPSIEAQMKAALTDWGIRYTWLGKIIRRIYKLIKG